MATLGEALLHALKSAGAKAVFGLPGDYALPFFQVMEESGILPLYTMSHEPGVGFAADGAARYGGGIGVAAVTYGAGAMSMVNAVACAWAEHSPLVVISGAPGTREMDRGLMLHHQIRTPETQMNVFREFTCAQTRLDDPTEAPGRIEHVLASCLKRSRPVYIEFPRDMVHAPCEAVSRDFTRPPPVPPSLVEACVQDIAERLGKSSQPVMLAGVQVRRFGLEENVFSLAEQWSVPLLNSFMGKGLFAGKGWPYVGTYLGLAGERALRDVVEEADLAMILGVIPCDTNWGISGKRMDEKSAILATADNVTVCSKPYPGMTLRALVPALRAIAFQGRNETKLRTTSVQEFSRAPSALRADDVAPALQRVLDTMNRKPPLVVDMGDCLFASMNIHDTPLLASGYYATMGFSVPAALGLQAATGDRPIVLVGDGGFQMTGWELINCARHGLDPIVIVFNNASWEMLRQFQPEAGYTKIAGLSYATLAKDCGGDGVTVKDASGFAAALENAIRTRGKFQLIELMLPPGDCTLTMKRYTAAIKANLLQSAA